MATQFRFDCPHCLTKQAGFTVVFQWENDRFSRARLCAICGVCNNGILLHSRYLSTGEHPNLFLSDHPYPGTKYKIIETWPSSELKIPNDVPKNISIFYAQGLTNLKSRQWDAAGSMFRKTLDVATKSIDPSNGKKTLYERINLLVSSGALTEAMGQWSHEIRLDGNDAVHDESPETEDDANAAQHFTEALLTYVYSLPAMVAANRTKRRTEEVSA